MKLAICDDDKKIRELIEESVREVAGDMEIEVFADARGILAPGFDADILFLDIQMPGIDGMNAARMIRADG
ncbi:MAG: response regulator, partial [Lachnospiraceae bacterium]|nr:response regulator [Lachnospiraceae bacterium]